MDIIQPVLDAMSPGSQLDDLTFGLAVHRDVEFASQEHRGQGRYQPGWLNQWCSFHQWFNHLPSAPVGRRRRP
jgi:hypothetical protein